MGTLTDLRAPPNRPCSAPAFVLFWIVVLMVLTMAMGFTRAGCSMGTVEARAWATHAAWCVAERCGVASR